MSSCSATWRWACWWPGAAWRRAAPSRRRRWPWPPSTGAGWLLDRYLTSAIYPEGTRNLSAEMATRLRSVHGAINVFEMAAGQLWRLAIDSWGVAGIGLIAAAAVIARRGTRADVRIMAALAVAVTAGIACAAPAALPPGWSQTWASGRYLDGMIAVFFVVGAAVLLRARARTILACAACAAGLTVLTGVIVAVYAGSSLPTGGFAEGVQLRRAGRADPGLGQCQRLGGDGGGAGPARGLGPDGARRPALA